MPKKFLDRVGPKVDPDIHLVVAKEVMTDISSMAKLVMGEANRVIMSRAMISGGRTGIVSSKGTSERG